jgi:hypothetical protein
MLFTGTTLVVAGFFWLSHIGPGSHYWGAVFGPGVIISFALGLLFAPLAAAATMDVERSEAGLASGLLNTARQVGGSLGLAVLATVATTHTHALEQSGVATGNALADGYARAFLIGSVIGIAAFCAAFIIPARAGRSTLTATAAASTAATAATASAATAATDDAGEAVPDARTSGVANPAES